jgi:superfamily I DNA and/or RNA helicase
VDSIVEKLRTTGMPFVVHGNPERLGEHARQYTVEAQVLRDSAVVAVRKEIDRAVAIEGRLRKRMELIANRKLPRLWLRWWQIYVETRYAAIRNDCDRWFNHTQGLRKALGEAKTEAEVRILTAARAHLSTMDGLASTSIPGDPKVAIIDEAGTVPEFKIPHLLSVGVRAIVAIGDQKQLQPFSHDQDASIDGYFQRAVRAIKMVPMLTIQYRMHPDVCDLVSKQFYDRKLQTAPPIAALRTADSANGLRWLDYPDAHAESRARDKKCNPVEVKLIERFMEEELPSLLAGGKTVAIITFYKHQLAQLMDAGRRAGCVRTEEEVRRRKATKKEAINLKPSPFKHSNFRILTVDAAQGSEADVVVLSCVRCNPSGDIGFLKNNNRLCVALSRARERLWIVGSRQTLVRHPLWRTVWEAWQRSRV